MKHSPIVGVCPSGDRARVGLADTTRGRALQSGVRRRPRDWCTWYPGWRTTAKPGGCARCIDRYGTAGPVSTRDPRGAVAGPETVRSRVDRTVADAGKHRHGRTVVAHRRAGVPRGTAERCRWNRGDHERVAGDLGRAGERDCREASTGHFHGTASGPRGSDGVHGSPAG